MPTYVWIRCEYCQRTFHHRVRAGRRPKFCKPSHKQRAYELRKLDALRKKEP